MRAFFRRESDRENRKGQAMKRVALAFALVVVAGTASAAIFIPPETPRSSVAAKSEPPVETGPVWLVRQSAPATLDTSRPPVPFVPLPKPPSSWKAAAPGAGSSEQQAVTAAAPAPSRPSKAVESQREVNNLSNGRCGGRQMRAIIVSPNGSIHVQC
jgi:hypothetical protein